MHSQSIYPHIIHTIYSLAKSKKLDDLFEMEAQGICLGRFYGAYNPIILLAKDAEDKAVEFLLQNFKSSFNHALQGYAWGKHLAQVDQLIKRGAHPRYAVIGFALGGHDIEVMKWIQQNNRYICDAIYGYALGGFVNQVKDLRDQIQDGILYAIRGFAQGNHLEKVNMLTRQDMSEVIRGYAHGGHFNQAIAMLSEENKNKVSFHINALFGSAEGGHVDQVNFFIKNQKSNNRYLHSAAEGYAYGGHINEVNQLVNEHPDADYFLKDYIKAGYFKSGQATTQSLLRLIAYTSHLETRNFLGGCANQVDVLYRNDYEKMNKLTAEGNKLHDIIQKYNLNFTHAVQLKNLSVSEKAWLFMGHQILNQLPLEIFYQITVELTGLSPVDIHIIFNAMNNQVYREITKLNLSKLECHFFSPKKHQEKTIQDLERTQKRLFPCPMN